MIAGEARARKLLTWGALITTLGVAISGTLASTMGGVVLVIGWAVVVAGIHSFGRAAGAAVASGPSGAAGSPASSKPRSAR